MLTATSSGFGVAAARSARLSIPVVLLMYKWQESFTFSCLPQLSGNGSLCSPHSEDLTHLRRRLKFDDVWIGDALDTRLQFKVNAWSKLRAQVRWCLWIGPKHIRDATSPMSVLSGFRCFERCRPLNPKMLHMKLMKMNDTSECLLLGIEWAYCSIHHRKCGETLPPKSERLAQCLFCRQTMMRKP